MNAVEIEQAISEIALQPFNATEFPFTFLAAFGNKETTLKRLRSGNNNASDVAGGVLLRNSIHLAVCASGTVSDTLKELRASLATTKAKAKFILATDGQTLEAEDLSSGETIASDFPCFSNHFGFLLPLAGISSLKEIKDNPIDVRATGRLNKLYVELLRENSDWATDERRNDLNHFMARMVFCFFAEDTDIFLGKSLFTQTVDRMSASDGSNTHEILSEIFRAMNMKVADRPAAMPRSPSWANGFPYVNGGLFSGSIEVPRFTRMARTYLLHAGALKWREINPDIFGSMIQAVADDEERGSLGMHYTSVPNILKVLNPLFLDNLHTALAEADGNERKLLNLRKRIARIRIFDPACGSGNFLVIAYKQMRQIEAEINLRRGEPNLRSEISIKNFRGIELRNFPAEIARLALIIAEFQADVLYRGQKDALAEFLPLDSENWIVCGNSLSMDWLKICPSSGMEVKIFADDLFNGSQNQTEIDFANEGGEIYICGNPPYAGSSKQSTVQKDEIARLFKTTEVKFKNLDYIAGWFWMAALYCCDARASASFVTTNSICQGEQVYLLWPSIIKQGVEIYFAHSSFKWKNLAANNAGVTCVIIGIRTAQAGKKFIYSEGSKREVSRINSYLIDYDEVFIPRYSESISGLPRMLKGNQPTDGGHLILSLDERERLLRKHLGVASLVRRLYGSKELIDGVARYCLWIEDEQLEFALKIPSILERLEAVTKIRLNSPAESTRKRAQDSHRFIQIQDYGKRAIVVPEVSSEKRAYIPCGLLSQRDISTNKLFTIYEAELYVFAVCSSRLHRVWAETVCGKLEERISYSNVIGYNTFPLPLLTKQNKTELEICAKSILLARESHFPSSIAQLYDPSGMPENLRYAHERNDEVLERIYIGRRFKNDTERLEKLFELYTKMTASKKAKPVAKAAKVRKKTS